MRIPSLINPVFAKKLKCTCNSSTEIDKIIDFTRKTELDQQKTIDCTTCLYDNCICQTLSQMESINSEDDHIVGVNSIFNEVNLTNIKTFKMGRYFGRLTKNSRLNPLIIIRLADWRHIAKSRNKLRSIDTTIDHIIPLSKFDMNNVLHIVWANDPRNLRFVDANYNSTKGSLITDLDTIIINHSKFLKNVLQKLKL